LVHKWRTEEQAILVGTNTVLDDNPKLDARDFSGNNPIRIVLDKSGKISKNYHVKDNSQKTIFITESENFISTENCIYENAIFDIHLISSICDILYKNEIQSVIIEGGSKTLQSFIDANLWDEARVFIGKTTFQNGTTAPIISGNPVAGFDIMNDELKIFKNYD
jgi:diaminohydroxyphosphoribosylaminopyrimidine deaminase/5-amino-6-(5-phosphoribosylamino)uracil reductase